MKRKAKGRRESERGGRLKRKRRNITEVEKESREEKGDIGNRTAEEEEKESKRREIGKQKQSG